MKTNKKTKKYMFTMMCLGLALAGTISSVNAASQTKKVYGGTIYAFANYSPSGKIRWTYNFGSALDNYANVKSQGVTCYREVMDERELFISGELYKVDYNYNTTKLGTADFNFYS